MLLLEKKKYRAKKTGASAAIIHEKQELNGEDENARNGRESGMS